MLKRIVNRFKKLETDEMLGRLASIEV